MIAVNGKPLDFNTTDDNGKLKDKRAEKVATEMEKIKRDYKFPIRMLYLKSMLTKNEDRPNRPDQPANIPIITTIKVDGVAGSEMITYFETSTPNSKGEHTFKPRMVPFSGSMLIPIEKIDLAWYLIKVYPHVKGGEAKGKRKKYYYLEDKAKEATLEAEAEKDLTRFKMLVYDEDFGFGDSKLRDVAKAHYITGVDQMHIDEVRRAINNTVAYNAKNNKQAYKQFLDSTSVLEDIKVKSLIQDGIEGKYIKLDHSMGKKKWRWLDAEGGYIGGNITVVLPGEKSHDVLSEHLIGSEEDRRTIQDLISTSKFKDVKKTIRPEQQGQHEPPEIKEPTSQEIKEPVQARQNDEPKQQGFYKPKTGEEIKLEVE